MRLSAARDTCIGSGQCAMSAPEVFDQDDDGVVVVVDEQPDGAMREVVLEAAERCPVGAIALEP